MADQQDGQLGQTLGGYRLLHRLGGGTFGTVYLATHLHAGSPAAVKILRTHLTGSKDFKRFLNEARTIRLRHPHIVPMLDFGVSKEDLPYLVMEYAAGGTLRHRHPPGTRLDLPTMLTYTEQLAEALQYAHDQRVIHCDLKPENILVREDGSLLLSDFGIAKVLEASSLAHQGTFLGTPAYMAPEQGSGKPCFASDQYALAVVLYEWITGQLPFQGSALEVAVQHRLDPPPALRNLVLELPSAVEQVVFKALSKEPMERFLSITTFAQAVREAFQARAEESTLSLPPTSGFPLVNGPASDSSSLLSTAPQPTQPSPPVLIAAPGQGNVTLVLSAFADEASVPAPGSSKMPTHILPAFPDAATPPSFPVPLQPPSVQPVQEVERDSVTLPPPLAPVRPRRLFSDIRVRVLICLVLVLVVGGSTGTWIVVERNATRAFSNRNATATATTTLTNRDATATAATTLATAGQVWYTQISGTSQTLNGVAWSGTQFVAVGNGGTILTSSDGRTWTTQNSGTTDVLYDIAWSGTQFVAVGGNRPFNHVILTSSDGRTWTTQNSGTIAALCIVWSGTQFVAVGDGGRIFTSPDGHTWTDQNSGTTATLYGIVWSGKQFVSVGHGGTILTSLNGRTWTAQNSGTTDVLYGIAWSGKQFVSAGHSGTILISSDEHIWTARNSGTSANLLDIAWSGSRFVAVGVAGTIRTSP